MFDVNWVTVTTEASCRTRGTKKVSRKDRKPKALKVMGSGKEKETEEQVNNETLPNGGLCQLLISEAL